MEYRKYSVENQKTSVEKFLRHIWNQYVRLFNTLSVRHKIQKCFSIFLDWLTILWSFEFFDFFYNFQSKIQV